MPSFLPHLVAPLLFALAFLPAERKRILAWAPLVFVPDLDYFFARELHRAALSNIWIPLALVVAILILWRQRDPKSHLLEFMFRPGAPANLSIATYYLLSHILMDFFVGGVVAFWPVTDWNFFVGFEIVVDTETNQPAPRGEGGAEKGIPGVSKSFPWLSVVDTAVGVFVATATAAWAGYRAWHRRRYPPAVWVERVAEADAGTDA